MDRLRRLRGFTLVEMSVVLVVIAIITAMGVSAGLKAIDSANRVATEKKLDVLEDALMTFRKKYNRLPCPADATLTYSNANYGIEAANNYGTCTGGTPAATYVTTTGVTGVPSGAIPMRTLGLPDDFMYDSWGRKFMYEVTPAMTADNAFSYSQLSDNCSITVYDNSNTALPINPVYDIVSFGKDGIGAYNEAGTKLTTGTVGTDESTNARGLYATSPAIRIKTAESGIINTTNYYDDIVRFKARYQLMDKNDRAAIPYSGPEYLESIATGGVSPQIVFGKKKCGKYQNFSGTIPAINGGTFPGFSAFMPSNTNLFVYFPSPVTQCKLYSIVGSTVTLLSATLAHCPTGGTAAAMAPGNGTIAVGSSSAPYLRAWSMIGSGASVSYSEIGSISGGPTNGVLAAMPEHLSFSQYGEYMAVSRHSATAYAYLFKKKGNTYQAMTTLDGSSAVTKNFTPNQSYTVYSNAISPNGRYYAVTVISGSDTQVYIWRNVNGVFTPLLSSGAPLLYTVTGMSAPYLSFSPDSTMLGIYGVSTGNNIVALYINPVTEVVSTAYAGTRALTANGLAFTPDGNLMVASFSSTGTGAAMMYRRSGSTYVLDSGATLYSGMTFSAGSLGTFVSLSR